MLKKLVINPTTGKLDVIGHIPQLSADPLFPAAEDAWVRASLAGMGGGKIRGMTGLSTPYISANFVGTQYQFSYRTAEGITKRVTLS